MCKSVRTSIVIRLYPLSLYSAETSVNTMQQHSPCYSVLGCGPGLSDRWTSEFHSSCYWPQKSGYYIRGNRICTLQRAGSVDGVERQE